MRNQCVSSIQLVGNDNIKVINDHGIEFLKRMALWQNTWRKQKIQKSEADHNQMKV